MADDSFGDGILKSIALGENTGTPATAASELSAALRTWSRAVSRLRGRSTFPMAWMTFGMMPPVVEAPDARSTPAADMSCEVHRDLTA